MDIKEKLFRNDMRHLGENVKSISEELVILNAFIQREFGSRFTKFYKEYQNSFGSVSESGYQQHQDPEQNINILRKEYSYSSDQFLPQGQGHRHHQGQSPNSSGVIDVEHVSKNSSYPSHPSPASQVVQRVTRNSVNLSIKAQAAEKDDSEDFESESDDDIRDSSVLYNAMKMECQSDSDFNDNENDDDLCMGIGGSEIDSDNGGSDPDFIPETGGKSLTQKRKSDAGDESPRKKRIRRMYNFQKINSFETIEEAREYIKTLKMYRFRNQRMTSSGQRIDYDCKHSRKCVAKLYVLKWKAFRKTDLYSTNLDHDHPISDKQRGLDESLTQNILEIFNGGIIKRNRIIEVLKDRGFEISEDVKFMYKINNLLAKLKKASGLINKRKNKDGRKSNCGRKRKIPIDQKIEVIKNATSLSFAPEEPNQSQSFSQNSHELSHSTQPQLQLLSSSPHNAVVQQINSESKRDPIGSNNTLPVMIPSHLGYFSDLGIAMAHHPSYEHQHHPQQRS